MDETSNDVSVGSSTYGGAESPAPDTSSSVAPDAIGTPQADGSSATPEAQPQQPIVPETDDDLQSLPDSAPYKEGLLNLRNAYRELTNQYQGVEQYYAPIVQQLEQIGGIETAYHAVDLASKLFTPQVDQLGQPVTDPYTGLPVTTTEPFVQHLAAQNWDTVLDMTEHLLSLPTATGEPLLAEVVRRVLGIDPNKLDLYRQVGSPADAARMGLLDIDPIELEDLPEKYHSTYTRLNGMQREAVQDPNLAQITREQMLEQYAQQHSWEDFRQSQEAEIARQQQQREYEYAQQIESHGEQTANALYNAYAGGLAEELGKVTWSTDPSESQEIQSFIMDGVYTYITSHPGVQPLYSQAYELIKQASRYEAMGNRMQANQARVRAAGLAQQVAGHARIYMTRMVNRWQGRMASTNGANGARPVIQGNGRNGPGGGNMQPRAMDPNTKFGSKEYLDDLFARAGR